MPVQFGPGTLSHVLLEAVQAVVDCAVQQQTVFNILPPGEGKLIITANFEGRAYTTRLPNVEKVSAAWKLLENLLEDIMCCANFFSRQQLESGCPKCCKQAAALKAGDWMAVTSGHCYNGVVGVKSVKFYPLQSPVKLSRPSFPVAARNIREGGLRSPRIAAPGPRLPHR